MFRIDPPAFILGALLLLILPLNWLAAALAAAAFHELCHIGAIYLLGGRVWEVRVGMGGAVMETEPMSPGRELVCALAGPLGSLLLVGLIRFFPRLALCALVQGAFNLLPIFPLDGGRALRCAVPSQWGDSLCRWAERGTVSGLLILGAAGVLFWDLGLLPLLAALLLAGKGILRKRPCK